ncbi:MAG: glycosyltransferase family 4 protein [Sedimentisphaerales bacterium]|nr:glycosyltransferase family 4 protein [Sedimentisphaerales bacterium]MBN2843019.1 glycosyltransferase family 4 protein [Sedimentisphaerales bacterium]
MKKNHAITTVCINARGTYDQERFDRTKAELGELYYLPQPYSTMDSSISILRHKFDQHWPFYYSRKLARAEMSVFDELSRQHDIIWYEKIQTAAATGMRYPEKSIIDLDDLLHLRIKGEYAQKASLRKKIAERLIYYKHFRTELSAIRKFKKVGICSKADLAYVSRLCPQAANKLHVIPNGFDITALTDFASRSVTTPSVIGFVGYLSYKPNYDGLCWFIKEVWPDIYANDPKVEFHIAGMISKELKLPESAGIKYLGFVDDLAQEMNSWTAMVVPLLSGGGTRLKILEGFARSCPVISTSTGAYGLEVEHGKNIMLADDPESFVRCCNEVCANESLQQKLSANACETFQLHYHWDKIGESIDALLTSMTSQR